MLYDRVEQTTTTTGTGALSLIPPSDASRRSFVQAAGNGGKALFCVETADGLHFEYSEGVATAGTPDTLTRSVIWGSNGTSPVNFPAGVKRVFSCLPAAASGFGAARLTSTWGSSLGPSGWERTPTGVIRQWSQVVTTANSYTWTYPIPFPNAVYGVHVTGIGGVATYGSTSTPGLSSCLIFTSGASQFAAVEAWGV